MIGLAALATGLCVVLLGRPSPVVRLSAVLPQSEPLAGPTVATAGGSSTITGRQTGPDSPRISAGLRTAGALGVAGAGWWLLGGLPGAASGAMAAAVAWWWLGQVEPAQVRRRRARLLADLPMTLDLFAACLHAGRPPTESLSSVASAIGGPLGNELRAVAARLSLGADPVSVWRDVAGQPPLAALGRTMVRALETGAPVADGLTRLVAEQRRGHRLDAERRARSVGVKAAAPLGLCFLPAFLLVGVVPTIASSFSALLH